MLTIWAMIQAIGGAPIPPPLPPRPTPEQMRAAKALFDPSPNNSVNSWGIGVAAAQIGEEALRSRNLYSKDRDFALDRRLDALARERQTEIIDAAITCVAEGYAARLQVADLEALKAFIATSPGARFWRLNQEKDAWRACFKAPTERVLRSHLDDEVAAVVRQSPKAN